MNRVPKMGPFGIITLIIMGIQALVELFKASKDQ